ncbi:ubiquitin conjugating enzyme [Aspergillus eucalypticola CBS 122712]|uniref:Ubiquitin conjugating enzyme n=1 Tax=Aspergillus eucalypticola (strain CBS 122712 / IBT 29274) TaxID=1448314 RepID=A0A317URZ8_ASPEC|nr:ubiquitin conjugating enzyme [Aspergillus eucalypticola CBS 122712]PWY64431.1 ubiquitin conjugating enzyme [Aspergillus eucalypticola CBS 122712]
MTISSLVRRGVEAALEQPTPNQPTIHFAGWLSALFVFTVLAFIAIGFSVEYTYGMLIPTLAAIEDSNPDVYVRIDGNLDANKPVDANEPDTEPVIETPPPTPITSKLRTTIQHLRARAGFLSRFRGLSMLVTYGLAQGLVFSMMPFSINAFFSQFVVGTICSVALANLQLAWVHIVISEPSPKRFYQRIPGFDAWKKIAPVVAFEHAVTNAAYYIPLILISACNGFKNIENPSGGDSPAKTFAGAATLVSLPALLSFVVSIPARAIFIRVAASMLPEEDESIVPFDRSFGGKVSPAIVGGSGKLSIMDAWKTFDRPALIRFVKAIGKGFAIEVAVAAFFTTLLVAQVWAGAVTYGFAGNNA